MTRIVDQHNFATRRLEDANPTERNPSLNAQYNPANTASQPDSRNDAETLHGSWSVIARLAWILVAILALVVFVVSIPTYYNYTLTFATQFETTLQRLGLSPFFYAVYLLGFISVTVFAFYLTAVLIIWRRSQDRMAALVSFMLITFVMAATQPNYVLADAWPAWRLPVLLVRVLGFGSLLIFLYVFPDGRFVPRWTRWLAGIWSAWLLSWLIIPAARPFDWSPWLDFLSLFVWFCTGLFAQVYRYRSLSTPAQRQQTKWVILGLAAPLLGYVLTSSASIMLSASGQLIQADFLRSTLALVADPIAMLTMLFVPLTIGISIFRFRLWDVDLLINRTLVYGVSTGALALFYVASVVVLQRIFQTITGQTSELALVYSTLAIAFLFMPLRRRVQNSIDRVFYRRRYDTAQTLAAFSEKVRDEVDLNKLTDDLLAVVSDTMEPTHVSLWLRKEANGSGPRGFELQSDDKEPAAPLREIAADDPIIARLQNVSGPMQVDGLALDSLALSAFREAGVKLSVPLVSQAELVGVLNLGPRLSEQEYSVEDRRLLNNLATQVAPAIRVAQLARQQQAEVRARERLEQELRVARLIQQTLLPDQVPALPGWQVATYYQPARAVGGDFYDFLHLGDGRLGFIVGDVADKGMPAALMMASARSFLRAACRRASSPGQVLEEVNELLCPDMPHNMFVTCLYAILDPVSGRLEYANAGQTLPYRRANGRVIELEATGVPLGVVPDIRYEESITTLEPGESLLFYSDGLVEAHNPQRQMFSFPRLEALVASHPGGTALIDFLLTELAAFTGAGWEQEDDVTLLAVHRSAADENRATTVG